MTVIGHVDNTVEIDAPIDFVFRQTNDVPGWPDLFTEYASAEILEQNGNEMTFRLTMHPDEQGRVWSWVSHRQWDEETYTVRARRVEKGPFEFMNIVWTYEVLGSDRTRMRWIQDFEMKPDAPVDTAGMTAHLNTNTHIQMGIIKSRVERRRQKVLAASDVTPNIRRGGDIRTLLAPSTVGSSSGFLGEVTLAPNERVTEHYHPYSEEYLYLVRGRLRVDLDDEPVTLSPGQAVLIPRNVRHRLVSTGSTEVLAVFQISPLAPRPELGHVDTEPEPVIRGES